MRATQGSRGIGPGAAYGGSDASVWLDGPGGEAKSCCLFATARNRAGVGLLLLHGGRQIVPAEWVRQMLTPSAKEPDYGLHLWLGHQGVRKGAWPTTSCTWTAR